MDRPLITRAPGFGPFHTVMLPGLVPDGPETFLRQAGLLRRHGSTAIITYPYQSFDLDEVLTAARDEVVRAYENGRMPVLMGVSVGGGLVLELLRRCRDAGAPLPLAGLVLVSPLGSPADLSPLLRRLFDGIVNESGRGEGGDAEAALERGRAFFKTLASRSAPAKPIIGGLRSLFALLTPSGIEELRERRIRARIEQTLASIPAHGAIARVQALQSLAGPGKGVLTEAPTLLLWGSKERHTLDMDGPGSRVLCRPDLATRLFPTCEVHWMYGRGGEEVPHASLLKHAAVFNRPLAAWFAQVRAARTGKRAVFGMRRFTASF
jgi:pimeloyl-ACP methyl ester carboxylesterase